MRILVDINHPAHVHLFKNLIWMLQRRGHQTLVTARQKDVTTDLLDALGIEYVCLSRIGSGMLAMGTELLRRYVRLFALARRFRPDAMIALSGVTFAPVGALLGVPRIVLEEAEHARLQRALSLPLATCIFTGTGYRGSHGGRHRRFRGIWVQAYLDPKYFTPDPAPLRQAGVEPDQPYTVLRRVSWGAAHDAGLRATSVDQEVEIVQRLGRFGRVLISSEAPLPEALTPYRSPVPPHHMHDLLAFAKLYLGEGGTMAAEAAVLGTPAVFCNPLRCGYLDALEHEYGLLRNCDSPAEGVAIAEDLLHRPDLASIWQQRRRRLLDESDDVVEFIYRLLVEYGRGPCPRRHAAAGASRAMAARRDPLQGCGARGPTPNLPPE